MVGMMACSVLASGSLSSGRALAGSGAPPSWPALVGTSDLFAADLAGVALHGFDAVSFFVGVAAPVPGQPDFELLWSGLAWRFAGEANRHAFRRDPLVYAPRIGGYDPLAVARGRLAMGDPLVFAVHARRLYLFRNAQSLAAFGDGPAAAVEAAEARWPELQRELVAAPR